MEIKKAKGKERKLLIVYIIQILRIHSDEIHPLSQQNILDLLASEYGMTVDRKSVRRNLLRLQNAGLPVFCRKAERYTKGRKESISLDWYWQHVFSETDIRTLQDALYFSRLPQQKVRALAEKLDGFRSRYFQEGRSPIRNLPHPDFLETVEKQKPFVALLAAALQEKKKVSFYYDHFEADGKWHHDRSQSGEDRLHKVNPYAILSADGMYFLLGNEDGEEAVQIYRVLRMSSLTVLDEGARPQKSLRPLENGLYPAQYMTVHSRPFLGGPETCTMDIAPEALTGLIEDFGKKARILSATASTIQVEVEASLSMAAAWAFIHGDKARVTSPPALVKYMRETAAAVSRLYGGT